MEGEGGAPKREGGSSGKAPQPPKKREESAPEVRSSFVSIDLEEVEPMPISTSDISEVEDDVEELVEDGHDDSQHEIEVEFEDGNVDKLLAMTGESWSIEDQQASLKEAAKDKAPDQADLDEAAKSNARPSLSIPTPYDFGAADLVTDQPARSAPPPLPNSAFASSSPQPAAPVRPSVPPPPLPPFTRDREETGTSSVRPPPMPARAAAAATAPTVVPGGANRRPPPPPVLKQEDSRGSAAAPVRPLRPSSPSVTSDGASLVELLEARVERLATTDDSVGRARANVELAIVHETLGEDAAVNPAAEAALKVDPDLGAAHAILRRRLHSRTQLVPMLRHLEREIAVASSEATAVELLAEKARLLEAGDRADDARESWELALGRAPHHAAAIKGLEADLVRRAFSLRSAGAEGADGIDEDAWEDLVAHLGRMSDAFAAQPNLAGWLHVERARILEMQLGRVDAARGAYERALRLDPGVGPVRDAFTMHAATHHDSARLAALLADEARLEPTSPRCARLELDAACITHTLLGDDARAIDLLERASARAPTTPSVDRRVLDELVRLYEASAQHPEAARSRRLRLRFFTDASALVYELRRLSSIEERLGNMENAIGDIERALSLDAEDATLVEELDRLLSAAGKDDERIALWHNEAQRAEDNTKRARALSRAAQLAEGLGRHDESLRHLRAAWVAAPGDSEVLDALSRLMSPAPTETFDRETRALIELYAQAAQSTRDDGRRVAYLEKVAMLWEELVGDPMRAARTYEEILRLEPGRRGAILGLERTAGRIGDDRALSLALASEAKLAEDGATVLALRVRSAQVLARVDAPRAAALVAEVLEQDPQHVAGRALETRLQEESGRWEQAAGSIRARIDIVTTTTEKVALWLALAHIQDARLRSPKDAVESLQEARKVDPIHPVPPEEIARVLEAAGDARALRVAIEHLASDAITPQERARHLTHAAEIDELRLDDDVSAATLYSRALTEAPEDEMIADRLLRVLARRVVTTAGASGPQTFGTNAWDELLAQLETRSMKATTPAQVQAYTFSLAALLVTANKDLPRATRMIESILDVEPRHVGALRLLESVMRRGTAYPPLARVLKMQGDGFSDVRARLGALWELASLEAWRLNSGESVATYTRILELDPTDPSGLEAAVRLSLAAARRGDASARRAAIAALRSLSALAQDEANAPRDRAPARASRRDKRFPTRRRIAIRARRPPRGRRSSAYRAPPSSSTRSASPPRRPSRGSRIASATRSGATAAAISLAELSRCSRRRAHVTSSMRRTSCSATRPTKRSVRSRATAWSAPPTCSRRRSTPTRTVHDRGPAPRAGAHLAASRSERLVDVFRSALAVATVREAIVLLGSEIARVARDDLGDIAVAIEAMRKVREAAPDHIPSLLTLSELFIAQRAWPEAVETLEDVVERGKESGPRITALFALASVYEKILQRPTEAERALRKALSIEGENPRAIRALIHRLAAKQNEPDENGEPQAKTPAKLEIASLLERLALVERDKSIKTDILLELSDIRMGLKDANQAEKALVDAVATLPEHPRAFARLGRFFRSAQAPGGIDAVSYARALSAVIGRGKQLGTSDPRWFASLGHIEVDQLNRLRDGVQHLSRAVQMDPKLHESRYELATAYSRLGAHDEAAKTVMSMLHPTSQPLVAISEPAKALELLERALNAERRQEEAIVVSELRAIAGELDEGRHAWLRSRRLGLFDQHHVALDRSTLVSHVVPPEGRHIMLDIAQAISGIESKLLRADISEIGITSRDRIGKRSGNPTRILLDRLAKAVGVNDVELVITPNISRTRVLAQDGLWVVVPKALTELPEPTQLASLGRALARIALNVPWLEELPPPHIEALLAAAGRAVNPSFGKDDIDVLSLKLVLQYEPNLVKEISRKQRQALEKLVPAMNGPAGRLVPIDVFIGALARAELRVAFLLTGDLLASIDELRGARSASSRKASPA